jgi:4-diphosphocytidyl-2-C-methyl-D-erythritol kinase
MDYALSRLAKPPQPWAYADIAKGVVRLLHHETLIIEAPAKLNLFLNITGRRPDGYHRLDSLFAFVKLSDTLEIAPAESLALRIEGPMAAGLEADANNLVLKAARLLARTAGIEPRAALTLTKRIPVAAGLGGGSADAAAALRGLSQFWGLDWPVRRLEELAATLGADVPACVRCRPVIARGIGELLSPAPAMPNCAVLLVNPLAATPTPAVFRAFANANPVIAPRALEALPEALSADALAGLVLSRGNDLTDASVSVTPEIATTLAALAHLPGRLAHGLSGSGATCFALFADPSEAGAAGQRLSAAHSGWWLWSGGWSAGG